MRNKQHIVMENNVQVPENGSILRSGLVFKKAVVEASHDVVISGVFDGKIISTAKVTLDTTSKFTGNIKCKDFECHGNFSGTLEVTDFAVFHSNCVLNGKVSVGHFSVEDGAVLNTDIKVNRKINTPAAAPVKK